MIARRCRGTMSERNVSSSVMGPWVTDNVSVKDGNGLRLMHAYRNEITPSYPATKRLVQALPTFPIPPSRFS